MIPALARKKENKINQSNSAPLSSNTLPVRNNAKGLPRYLKHPNGRSAEKTDTSDKKNDSEEETASAEKPEEGIVSGIGNSTASVTENDNKPPAYNIKGTKESIEVTSFRKTYDEREIVEIEDIEPDVSMQEIKTIKLKSSFASHSLSFDTQYDGPSTLPSDIVKFIPSVGTNKYDPAELQSIQRARSDFEQIVGQARKQHSEMLEFIRSRGEKLINQYHSVEERTISVALSNSAFLNGRCSEAESYIDIASNHALLSISKAAKMSYRMINSTAAWGRLQISNNSHSAANQVSAIVNQLASNYTNVLVKISEEIINEGLKAVNSVKGFISEGASLYKDSGDALEDACQEARRNVIPTVGVYVSLIDRTAWSQAEEYNKIIPTIIDQFDNSSIGAKLHERKNDIKIKGDQELNKAVDKAIEQLKSQAKAAHTNICQMRNSAKAQIRTEHNAAVERIATQEQSLIDGTAYQTDRGITGLKSATQAGLPAFANVVRRTLIGIKKAGESGPRRVSDMTDKSKNNAPVNLTEIACIQREKLTLSMESSEKIIKTREQQTGISVEADKNETCLRLNRSAFESTKSIDKSAEQYKDAFNEVKRGVESVITNWAMPLAQYFSQVIRDTLKQQSEAKGKGSFAQWSIETGKQKDKFIEDELRIFNNPMLKFKENLDDAASKMKRNLEDRISRLVKAFGNGLIDRTDEAGVTSALRGLTAIQGRALRVIFSQPGGAGKSLDTMINDRLGDKDKMAALSYLAGDKIAGLKAELEASVHWYNDDESRIEEAMRALSPSELKDLKNKDSTDPGKVLETIRDNLGGTDLNVFDSLREGNHARADAYRMMDRIDEARRNDDNDSLHNVLAEYSGASQDSGWKADTDARRTAVQKELAFILNGGKAAENPSEISEKDAAIRVEEYALRPIKVQQHSGEGEPITITLTVEGANRDLTSALIHNGEGSVQARAARLGVEIQRSDGPKILNIDSAMVDPRLDPKNHASPEELKKAKDEHEEVIQLFAKNYGGENQAGSAEAARAFTEKRLGEAFGEDKLGKDLAVNLLNEESPSAETAAMALMYAARGLGTDEDLTFRFTERMSRKEVSDMRNKYEDPEFQRKYPDADCSGNLNEDLGTFGHDKWYQFGEFSGDEKLRMERALMGQPQNDLELAEVAAFSAQQQKDETGWLGSFLASDSMEERALTENSKRLTEAVGARAEVDNDGNPVWFDKYNNRLPNGPSSFDPQSGKFKGNVNREEILSAANMTRNAAVNYSSYIDTYANFAATSVAVLGAVAAAVATVVTGGAASPLLMASIAGISGLATMGVRSAISGGRYGWEQAATDLGVTATQALTAGVGQHIAIVSRGGTQSFMAGMRTFKGLKDLAPNMGKITGSAFGDMVLMGAATGGLGTAGHTAFSEETWRKGLGDGIEHLFQSVVAGILSGAASSFVSNSFEAIKVGPKVNGVRISNIGEKISKSTNPLMRGGLRGVSSAMGGFAGREVELAVDKAAGRFKGDSGDIFQSGLEAAGQAAVQDSIGGAIESRVHERIERLNAKKANEEAAQAANRNEETASRTTLQDPSSSDVSQSGRLETVVSNADSSIDSTSLTIRNQPSDSPSLINEAPEINNTRSGSSDIVRTGNESSPAIGNQSKEPEFVSHQFSEGTAAGVHDSDFHGNAVTAGSKEAAKTRDLKGSVRRLLGLATEIHGASLPDPKDPTRIALKTQNGEEVSVQIRLSNKPLPVVDGISPVAHFIRDSATGGYIVEVSAGAPARHVERALAHELAEIQAGHGHTTRPDVLNPKSNPKVSDTDSTQVRLSAHDQGRLAELSIITRQIETARTSAERENLLADADALITHLGLSGSSKSADARRAIVVKALVNEPEILHLLSEIVIEHSPAANAITEINALRKSAHRSGLVDEDMLDLPGAPQMTKKRGDPTPGRSKIGQDKHDSVRVKDSLRKSARDDFGQIMQDALLDIGKHSHLTLKALEYMTPSQIEYVVRTGKMPKGFEFHHLMSVADYPEFAHRGDVGTSLPSEIHKIAHDHNTSIELETASFLRPDAENLPSFHNSPEAKKYYRPRKSEIAEGSPSTGDQDRDIIIEQKAVLRSMENESQRLQDSIDRLNTSVERAKTNGKSDKGLETLLNQSRARQEKLQKQIREFSIAIESLENLISKPVPAASEISGTEMKLAKGIIITDSEAAISRALPEVIGPAGPIHSHLISHETVPGGALVKVVRADGTQVTVRITVGQTQKGDIANFRCKPGPDGYYEITLSSHASEKIHSRALAHELEEIRYHKLSAQADDNDALQPGKSVDKETRLSAHDRGRLAELEIIHKQLDNATRSNPRDENRIAQLEQEAQKLVSHLGLVHGKNSGDRYELIKRSFESEIQSSRNGMSDDAPSTAVEKHHRAFLDILAKTMHEVNVNQDPFLQPRPMHLDDFAIIAKQIDRARELGDATLADQLLQHARSLVRDFESAEGTGNRTLVSMKQFKGAEKQFSFEINPDVRKEITETAIKQASNSKEQEIVRSIIDDICERELARENAFAADDLAKKLQNEKTNKDLEITDCKKRIEDLQGKNDFNKRKLESDPASSFSLRKQAEDLEEKARSHRGKKKTELINEAGRLRARASMAESVSAKEIKRLKDETESRKAEILHLQEKSMQLENEIRDLDNRITDASTRAAAHWGIATKPDGAHSPGTPVAMHSPGTLRNKAAEIDKLRWNPASDKEQQEIVNQRFADAPEFQPFHELLKKYYERNPENRYEFGSERRVQLESRLFADWSRGRYFSSENNSLRALDDLPFISATKGKEKTAGHLNKLEKMDLPATTRPLVANDTDSVISIIKELNGVPLPHILENQLRTLLTDKDAGVQNLSIGDTEKLSMALVRVRDQLEQYLKNASSSQEKAISDRLDSVNTAIRDVREALGVAAGLHAAKSLLSLKQEPVLEGHGRDTVDLVFGDPDKGPVIVLECKGSAQQRRGTREAQIEGTGVVVRAEQGTREYLLSVSRDMQKQRQNETPEQFEQNELTRNVGAAINQKLINDEEVRYIIIRQEFNPDGSLGAIKYIEYSMKRKPQ